MKGSFEELERSHRLRAVLQLVVVSLSCGIDSGRKNTVLFHNDHVRTTEVTCIVYMVDPVRDECLNFRRLELGKDGAVCGSVG